jgi:serine protease inhibitor ecotin
MNGSIMLQWYDGKLTISQVGLDDVTVRHVLWEALKDLTPGVRK